MTMQYLANSEAAQAYVSYLRRHGLAKNIKTVCMNTVEVTFGPSLAKRMLENFLNANSMYKLTE